MMKARQYDRRFFSRGIQPHVYAIVESNHVDKFAVDYFCNGDMKLTAAMDTIIKELHDAKEYGSILTVTPQDWSALYDRFVEITGDINMSREVVLRELLPLVQVTETLAQKYDVVVTNPPYMPVSNVDDKLNSYVKENYPNSKIDLYSVFIEKCHRMTKNNGYQSMITMHSWMFLTSFEKLRENFSEMYLVNMVHLGARAFEEIGGEVVQTTSFVFQNSCIGNSNGVYCQMTEQTSQDDKESVFLQGKQKHIANQNDFQKIPGTPMAYWVTHKGVQNYDKIGLLRKIAVTKQGFKTGNNDLFLKLWFEVSNKKIDFQGSNKMAKWFPCNKGGTYRKWFGNQEYIVNWENDGFEIKNYRDEKGKLLSRPQNLDYNFREGLTWSSISSGPISLRYSDNNMMFESKGSGCFADENVDLYCLQAFLNSIVGMYYIHALAPTLDYSEGALLKLPYDIKTHKDISELALDNIAMCKDDWNAFEVSWDFQHHPLLRKVPTIAEAFEQWQTECDDRFNQLKANEEELNRIFIDIYGLQDELTPEVEDKDVTVRKSDLGRDIRSFISYAVGCMFGRYSLYKDGLVFAGEPYSLQAFADKMNERPNTISEAEVNRAYYHEGVSISEMFAPDTDNIIPICDDEYFTDDIVGRFVEFVEAVYGADTLDENLKFIADELGSKGQPKDVIRNYFLSDFYSDHCKIYQKRPIYWLFDSGKKNGFKALIYMHRYQPDTIARIRTDYVHEQQARYRTAIADLDQRIANASTGDRVKLKKKLTNLQEQDTEIRIYEEKIHHLADQMISIDLDDGVKKNYAIFQDVLAKIK